MLGVLPLKAVDGGIEPGIHYDLMANRVILVHAVFMVGHDDVRFDLSDDVANGKADLIVVRQQSVGIVQHIGFAAQLPGEGFGLRNLAAAVLLNVRTGGSTLFPGSQGQGHGFAAVDGAGGQQRAGGELRVADVGADGENGVVFVFHQLQLLQHDAEFPDNPESCAKINLLCMIVFSGEQGHVPGTGFLFPL